VIPPAPSSHRVVTDAAGAPLLVKRATGPEARARLAREAAVLGRMADHPGTVRVRAHLDDGAVAELHLAWVGPHSLATVTGLPATAAAAAVAGVAEVVADLHATGIAHRRLTADHVLLAADRRPVLTGLADAGPGGPSEAAADVAALGALLTELVGPLDEPPVVPERRRARRADSGLRGALLTLADHAQAHDPAVRPSAAELAALLRTAATPPRRARRRRSGTATVAGEAAAVGTAAIATSPPLPAVEPAPVPVGPATTVGDDRPAGTAPHRPARGRPRHLVAATVLGIVVAATLVAAWLVPTRDRRPSEPTAVPSTTAPRRPPSTRAEPPAPITTTAPAAVAVPACPDLGAAPAADVDGDGCAEAVRIDRERVTAAGTTWVVGRPGDALGVGDWDCDGRATLASVRPATGEVFVFDGWAAPGADVTVRAATTVPGAAGVRAVDPDGDGCATLTVDRADGPAVEVPVGADR